MAIGILSPKLFSHIKQLQSSIYNFSIGYGYSRRAGKPVKYNNLLNIFCGIPVSVA